MRYIEAVLFLLGVACVIYGSSLIYVPAAWVLAGAFLLFASLATNRG